MEIKFSPIAETYFSGKQQLTEALVDLAHHIHAPAPALRKLPDMVTEDDITKIRLFHEKLAELAKIYDLQIKPLNI